MTATTVGTAMTVTGRGRPTHLLSTNKRVRLWHRRLGHPSNARVVRASKLTTGIDLRNKDYDRSEIYSDSEAFEEETPSSESIPNSPPSEFAKQSIPFDDADKLCDPCVATKFTRVVQQKKMTPATQKLEEVHVDLWGPHYPPSFAGKQYAAILICSKTRKSWVIFLRTKDKFVDVFQTWLPQVENQSQYKMQNLRADGGGEFISLKLKAFCEEKGISIKYAAPYMHEENGLAERGWRTIATMKDSLLVDSGLPNNSWADAMNTANYLRNRLPTKCKEEIIPEEAWTDQKQDLRHLRIFGSVANVGISKEKRSKSDIKRTWKGIFVGYSPDTTKHYRVYAPQTRQLVVADAPSIDESEPGAKLLINFPLENTLPKRKAPTGEPKPRGRPRKIILITTNTSLNETPQLPVTESGLNIGPEVAMLASETSSKVYEPISYEEAVNDPIHGRRWREAIDDELDNLATHHT